MRVGQAETPHAALAQLVEHRIRNVLANIPFFPEMHYLQ
jgi:hypothetical protein